MQDNNKSKESWTVFSLSMEEFNLKSANLVECFLYKGYVHTWECPGWKKTQNLNLIGGREEGRGGGGWNKNVLGGKISKN